MSRSIWYWCDVKRCWRWQRWQCCMPVQLWRRAATGNTFVSRVTDLQQRVTDLQQRVTHLRSIQQRPNRGSFSCCCFSRSSVTRPKQHWCWMLMLVLFGLMLPNNWHTGDNTCISLHTLKVRRVTMTGRQTWSIYKFSAVHLSILDQFASHNEILSDITLSSRQAGLTTREPILALWEWPWHPFSSQSKNRRDNHGHAPVLPLAPLRLSLPLLHCLCNHPLAHLWKISLMPNHGNSKSATDLQCPFHCCAFLQQLFDNVWLAETL